MTFPAPQDNEVPALGRPLHLGMLYDRRSDTFVPGMTLWDPETLRKHIHVKPQPKTEFQVLASDSYEHLASALRLTLPLRASLLGGHVDLNGSARYLKDTKKSQNQARVVLHSSITTRFEELTMTHLGPQNVTYPGVFDQGEATHVVTAVLYGAQAFFVFDREVTSMENKDDVEKAMRTSVQSLCNKVHGGEGTAHRPEKERKNTENFKCTFYGDVALEINPITDPDAMKIYSALPKLLGEKGEKAVPVKIWLYPLAKLDHRAAKLVREISADLVSRAQGAVEQLRDCEAQCHDLLSNSEPSFPVLCEKVQHFQDLCKRYRDTFQERVAKILPSIRGGEQEEAALRDLLTWKEQSPFHPKQLLAFLNKKSAEMDYVKLFCRSLKDADVVPSAGKLKEVLLDHQYKYVLSFTFTSLQTEEPYFRDLEDWIQQTSDPASTHSVYKKQISKQWFEEETVDRKARERMKLFVDFASLNNKEKGKTRFIVSSVPDVDNPGISIYFYKEGQLISRDFEPPLKPLPLLVGEIGHDSVQLRFEPAADERALVSRYFVEYKILGQESWTGLNTANEGDSFVVGNLLPNTSYQFRWALQNSPDHGRSSGIGKVIKTLPTSPPGKPQNTVLASSAICVTWRSPSAIGAGVHIKEYKVKYAEEAAEGSRSGTGGWAEVTAGKSGRFCRVTGLKPGTPYRFHVVAVATDGGESAPSEEAVIATLGKEKASEPPRFIYIESPRPRSMGSGEGRESELRIILVGRSGCGTSATGNIILGREEFESVPGESTASGKCQRGSRCWNGQKVSVVDTRAICDSDICSQESLVEIMRCVCLSKPGPHALVFVTQVGCFTSEDKAAAERVLDVFGMDSARYMIVLFTQKEDSGGRSVEDYLSGSNNRALQELMQKCRYRHCALSHNAAREDQVRQVSELMLLLQIVVCQNRGEPYINALYTEGSLTESKVRSYVAENRRARRNAEGKCCLS